MSGFAWVTLATNDSYSLGALVLAHSLRRVGSKHDLAVLVTPGVTGAMREKLASVFSLVQEVNVLDSKDEANLALLARPELGITFTKLHCWRLTQYEKCVFLDADTLVIRNCDELFEREEFSAAPDVGWPDCFNSGVFVFKPSQQTFASITSFAAAKGSFDGGDQGLLNQYFSDWAHKDISKHLPFIYNMCSTATYSYLPAFKQFGDDARIIHFIGITKPWLQYFDTVTGQVQPAPGTNHLQPLLQLWWQIFCENVHPQLSPVMASSTLATVWHEFSPPPSQSPRPTTHNENDYSYENIRSIEPDFSEFQDPWDNYVEQPSQTYIPTPANSSNENDNFFHQSPTPPPLCTTCFRVDSQNHADNNQQHREYINPSVLDDSRTKPQDNREVDRQSTIEHRNISDRQHSHGNHNQTQSTSQTCGNNRQTPDRGEDRHESRNHHEQSHQEQIYHHKNDHHHEQQNHQEQIHHHEQNHQQHIHHHEQNHQQHIHHHEQNHQQQNYHHKNDYHHEQIHQEQIHHHQQIHQQQIHHHEQIHQQQIHHHEQNHQEQIHHHKNDHHHEQNYSNDNHGHFQHQQQEHHHQENPFEKISQPHEDRVYHEEKRQEHCHNQKTDDFCANSPESNYCEPCYRAEVTVPQSGFEKHDKQSRSIENRLQDKTNTDSREKHTDVCTTKPQSSPECTAKCQSPPKPCSKSKCIATQSEPNIAGQLESNDAGIAGALAKITLGEARSPEQVAFEEHMRKQSWEQGQIDYMGRDSFENIWKKISETLGAAAQRQPSPPKVVPKPEKSEVDVAPPVLPTGVELTAKKSEAAVTAEPRQKEEQDLSRELAPDEAKVTPPSARPESRQTSGEEAVPAQSSISDAAVSPVALSPIEPLFPAVKTSESTPKNDNETSIIATATTTLDSSIPQPAVCEAAQTDLAKTPAAAAAALPEEAKTPQEVVEAAQVQPESTSSQSFPDSPVPIQVAESVLEAEVKESVTEDLRPVTEEAIVSISVSAQESVPAVLETVLQAAGPPDTTPNGSAVLDPISETGNVIDEALSLSSPLAVSSAAVTVAEGASEVATTAQIEETRPSPLEAISETADIVRKEETTAPRVTTLEDAKIRTEIEQLAASTVEPVAATLEETKSKPEETGDLAETEQSSVTSAEPVAKPEETKPLAETEKSSETTAEPVEKAEETKPPTTETEQSTLSPIETVAAEPQVVTTKITQTAASLKSLEASEKSKIALETEKSSPTSVETTEKPREADLAVKSDAPAPSPIEEPKIATESEPSSASSAAIKSEDPKVPTKTEESSAVPKLEQVELSSKLKEPVACPIKPEKKTVDATPKAQEKESSLPIAEPVVESKPVVASSNESSIEKDIPKAHEVKDAEISEDIASQSESSEESPIRPTRTKEAQIPGTPTVTEATPPTSPPIGALESFEDQPTKTTKKVVKKVVKKTTSTETKPADGAEAEAEAKKVTKKIVKKVTKKTKEDDAAGNATAAEGSSTNDKPKKLVKVTKKTTKTGQTLEADTTVPETPPPGTSEVPVPPKRKLKTTGKSTSAKTDPEP